MYDTDLNAPPFNPLPKVILLLALVIGGIEVYFQAGSSGFVGGPSAIGWRAQAAQQFAFSDTLFDWMRVNGQYALHHMMRFFTYSFVHQTFLHAMFTVVFILAIGKYVAERVNAAVVLAVFFGSAAIGAAVYSIALDEPGAMIGAYPAVYGIIGAFTWLRFTELQEDGENGLRAFNLIIVFMIIALVYKIIFGGTNQWLAELVAFFVGFALTAAFGPDAKLRLAKLLSITRQR